MPIDDPATWAQGATALKNLFDGLRSAIGLLRDARDLGGPADPAQSRAIEQALDQAERGALIAEAEIAKALGYELCRCVFPPTVMLAVGYIDNAHAKLRGQVYECPLCGINTASHWAYKRVAPPRVQQEPRRV